jgi:hypothetical protein
LIRDPLTSTYAYGGMPCEAKAASEKAVAPKYMVYAPLSMMLLPSILAHS